MMSSLIAPASEISLLYLTPRYRVLGRKGQTNYQAHVIIQWIIYFTNCLRGIQTDQDS